MTVWRMFAPGLLSVPVGFVVSRCHVQLSGDASVLPAASVARTSNVCVLSASPERPCGLVHDDQLPPSIRHSNVEPASVELKAKLGVAALDGTAGLVLIVVFRARRCHATVR